MTIRATIVIIPSIPPTTAPSLGGGCVGVSSVGGATMRAVGEVETNNQTTVQHYL